ncbi:hypothetical protein SSAG_05911 [Streptomyces sp. Mg1]|nr:hypothetical protein SSAG_05911 [Streptomyces sp. Mg1]
MNALQLLFALLLVLANGFFVGAEFALVSVRRSQIEPLAAESQAGPARWSTACKNLHPNDGRPPSSASPSASLTLEGRSPNPPGGPG